MYSSKDLAVCISTHNNLNYLKLCVESVRKNFTFNDCEINVYAENCTDGTDEWLQSRADINSKIEHNEIDKGVGQGMNTSAEMTNRKFIIFLHSDMYVCKGYDIELMKHIKPRTIVTSYRIEPDIFNKLKEDELYKVTDPGLITIQRYLFGEYHSNFKSHNFERWTTKFAQINENLMRKSFGAGGYLISKEDWDYVGGNDTQFSPAAFDDFDIFIRMQLAKLDFIMTSKSILYHFGSRSGHFPTDDFTSKMPERQRLSEEAGIKKYLAKWKEYPTFDQLGFIKVPEHLC